MYLTCCFLTKNQCAQGIKRSMLKRTERLLIQPAQNIFWFFPQNAQSILILHTQNQYFMTFDAEQIADQKVVLPKINTPQVMLACKFFDLFLFEF